MLKYFELLLELLRTDDDQDVINMKKNFLAAGQKIEERGDRNLQIFHKCGFVFEAFNELIDGKIGLDEFLATGDITSKRNLISNKKSSLDTLYSIIDESIDKNGKVENTLFILDTISLLTLSENEKQKIQNRAKNNNNELIFC